MAFTPRTGLSSDDRKAIADHYVLGASTAELASRWGVSSRTVQRCVQKKLGVRARGGQPQYFVRQEAFAKFTDDAAYWLGVLMADGSIRTGSGSPTLRLGLKDRDHIKLFRDFLGTTRPVPPTSEDGTCRFEVRITEAMREHLARVGIVPRKTKRAAAHPTLAANKHFWRGVFDGDGCLHIHKRGYPLLVLVGSESICKQFVSFVQAIAGTKANPRPRPGCWMVQFGGYRYVPLVKAMYDEAPTYLERKKVIADQILQLKGEVRHRLHA